VRIRYSKTSRTYLTVKGIILVLIKPCLAMQPRLLEQWELGPISKQEAVPPLRACGHLHIFLRTLLLVLRWYHDSVVMKS